MGRAIMDMTAGADNARLRRAFVLGCFGLHVRKLSDRFSCFRF
jgi:hypothetical protein